MPCSLSLITPPPPPPLDQQIKGLVPGGLVEKDGRLKIGDRLISVNGNSSIELSYKDVVQLITSAEDPLTLVVKRHAQSATNRPGNPLVEVRRGNTETSYSPATLARIQQKNLKVVEVVKGPTGLGMMVAGSDTKPYTPIIVKDIIRLGPADKTGQIFQGDVILKVNAVHFGSIGVSEAKAMLKELPQGPVELLLKEREGNAPQVENTARK